MTSWRDMADRLEGKAPTGARRSGKWRGVRDDFLRGKRCEVCGGRKSLTAHHEIPFHLAPDLELDPGNLIALCQAGRFGINCHLLIGHVGNWQRTNVTVRASVAYWNQRLIGDR